MYGKRLMIQIFLFFLLLSFSHSFYICIYIHSFIYSYAVLYLIIINGLGHNHLQGTYSAIIASSSLLSFLERSRILQLAVQPCGIAYVFQNIYIIILIYLYSQTSSSSSSVIAISFKVPSLLHSFSLFLCAFCLPLLILLS